MFFILLFCVVSFTLQAQNQYYRICEQGKWGFMDSTGKVVLQPQMAKLYDFKNGFARFQFENKFGFLNEKLEVAIPAQFDYADDFYENLAAVYLDKTCYFINPSGQKKFEATYYSVSHFQDGLAFVRNKNTKIGIIDTTGKVLAKNPNDKGYEYDNNNDDVDKDFNYRIIEYKEEYPNFFAEYGLENLDLSQRKGLYAIFDKYFDIIIDAKIQRILTLHKSLIFCFIDDKYTYLNIRGKIIWQEKVPSINSIQNLNEIFFSSNNYYVEGEIKIVDFNNLPKDSLFIRLNLTQQDTLFLYYNRIYRAFQCHIYNLTNSIQLFNSVENGLNLFIEALDTDGQWKRIEYQWYPTCGTFVSYQLSLKSNHYFSVAIPIFEGDFKTKCRIALEYKDLASKRIEKNSNDETEHVYDTKILYSEVYDGFINKSQFWLSNEKLRQFSRMPNSTGVHIK